MPVTVTELLKMLLRTRHVVSQHQKFEGLSVASHIGNVSSELNVGAKLIKLNYTVI